MLKRLFQRKPVQNLSCEIVNSGFAFDLEEKATILQSAMKAGVTMAHNCQVGSCKECCCKLIDGEIKSQVELDYLFDKSEIDAGYFLPCQSIAKSNVVIEPLKSVNKEHEDINGVIESISDLTVNIKRLTIKTDKALKPEPGQYSNIFIPAIQQYRSYSFSNQDDVHHRYCFDITYHPSGQVSPWLLSQSNIGQKIQLSKPIGDFSLVDAKGPVLCITAGSGQGAVMNILKNSVESLKGRLVFFFSSSKTLEGQYLRSDLAVLSNTLNIKHFPFLTQSDLSEHLSDSARAGRIPAQIESELKVLAGKNSVTDDFSQWSVLLCGSPGLIDDSLRVLGGLGFSKNNISYDKYEVSGG